MQRQVGSVRLVWGAVILTAMSAPPAWSRPAPPPAPAPQQDPPSVPASAVANAPVAGSFPSEQMASVGVRDMARALGQPYVIAIVNGTRVAINASGTVFRIVGNDSPSVGGVGPRGNDQSRGRGNAPRNPQMPQ